MEYTLKFPKYLTQQEYSVAFILNQFNKIKPEFAPANVLLDFSETFFIGGEMTALITALVKILQDRNFTVKITKLQSSVSYILERNGFLERFGLSKYKHDKFNKKTAIPLFIGYSQNEIKIIRDYLNNEVFSFVKWPNQLHDKSHDVETINSAIFETTRNISEHSGSNTVFMCGQFYPERNHLRLTITDTGVTIPTNLRNHIPEFKEESDVFLTDWATNSGNTTKTNIASGLGLYSIKDTIVGEGEFTIISRNAFWKQTSNGTIITKALKCTMPGTFIHLNFFLGSSEKSIGHDLFNGTIEDDLLF